jgi:hypothetical protein
MYVCMYVCMVCIYIQVSQELRAILRDLIPELMLSKKHHIHVGPIRNGSGVMRFELQ